MGSSDQCIVMPLRPHFSMEFGFVGLALHFLLGNVISVNSFLDECWFGWRATKIFTDPASLSEYCSGDTSGFSVRETGRQQNVRFWIHGLVDEKTAALSFYDAEKELAVSRKINFSCDDHLTSFRSLVMDWLDQEGIPWTGRERAACLWPEPCSMTGLDAIGKALLTTYDHSFVENPGQLSLKCFQEAVQKAPEAFMSHDLLGWALYRNKDYQAAVDAFKTALTINPGGAGAMSGLMWCCIMSRDQEGSLYWAGCKADVCGKEIGKATEKALRIFQKYNPAEKSNS